MEQRRYGLPIRDVPVLVVPRGLRGVPGIPGASSRDDGR